MQTLKTIAAYYEIDAAEYRDDICASLEQSRENAGKHGKSRLEYFDGYMLDIIAFSRSDAAAARDFESRAY